MMAISCQEMGAVLHALLNQDGTVREAHSVHLISVVRYVEMGSEWVGFSVMMVIMRMGMAVLLNVSLKKDICVVEGIRCKLIFVVRYVEMELI